MPLPAAGARYSEFADQFSNSPPHRHCEERSDEAIHISTRGKVDCFASLAMTWMHESTFPRHDLPEVCNRVVPLSNRGRGESRAPTAPAASFAKMKKQT